MTWARWLWQRLLWLIAWLWRLRRAHTEQALPPASTTRPLQPQYKLVHVEDDPEELALHTLYAVGESGNLWHVVMACPCGCGVRVALNALPDDSPRWSLLEDPDGPSLTPSVWRTSGCRSHFILRRGRIFWCGTWKNY